MSIPTISTPITELFGIKHPIMLAGMNVAAGPELAAAVSNAGGLGVIGGLGYTPKVLRAQVLIISLEVTPLMRTSRADQNSQRLSRQQKGTFWCRPAHSSGRRCREED